MPRRASLLLFLFFASLARGGTSPVWPDPEVLLRVLRTNLVVSSPEFNREAASALVSRFGGKFLEPDETEAPPVTAPAIVRRSRFDGGILCVQVGQVGPALAPQLQAALQDVDWTNAATGLVLDLRFAVGDSFESAGRVAALFSDHPGELIQWGEGSVRTDGTAPLWTRPVAVLVNGGTRGSPEALSAVLRLEIGAVVIGQVTAGQASVLRDLTLEGGARIRIPVAPIRLGDGSVVPPRGLQPDISVRVTPEQEKAYQADPFTPVVAGTLSGSGTNQVVTAVTVRRRVNEAELVRAQREGSVPGDLKGGTNAPPARIVHDPALARSLDLIRGMAILRKR